MDTPTAMCDLRVMITSGGGPGVWGLLHALRRWPGRSIRLYVSDPAPQITLGTGLADVAVRLRFAHEPGYVDGLVDYCRQERIDVLLPVFDGELVAVAERRDAFAEVGTRILLPPTEVVQTCVDKWQTHAHLADSGLLPDHVLAATADETAEAIGRLGYPGRKLCVRPTNLAGGRGLTILDSAGDDFVSRVTAKPGPAVCTAEEFLALRRRGPESFPLIVSEYLEGREIGVDALCDDGMVVAAVVRHKHGTIMHGNPSRIAFAAGGAEREWAAEVAAALRLSSLVSIDGRYGVDGRLRLLEVNARPGAYIGVASAQTQLLAWAIDRLLGQAQAAEAYQGAAAATGALRVFADLVTDEQGLRLLPIEAAGAQEHGCASLVSGCSS